MAGDFESGTNEENNGDMREEGRKTAGGFIWTVSNLGGEESRSVGRLGICYRSQLPMMPKPKRRAGFLAGHVTN